MKKRFVLIIVVGLGILSIIGLVVGLKYSISSKSDDRNYEMGEKLEENLTVVDVTNLDSSMMIEHEHLFKTMYNYTNHWEECRICGKRQNEVAHSFKEKYSLGYVSCEVTNSCTYTCSCGYSKVGHLPCKWDGKSVLQWPSIYQHRRVCTQCKSQIAYEYYWNNKLYGMERYCHLSNGNRIYCGVGGKCAICGYMYSTSISNHELIVDIDGNIICKLCNNIFGKCETIVEHTSTRPIQYTIKQNIKLENGASFGKINSTTHGKIAVGYLEGTTQSINKTSDTEYTVITKGIVNSSLKDSATEEARSEIIINKTYCKFGSSFKVFSDFISPDILNLVTENEDTLTEWSRTKPIIISGTENWTNTVNVEIVDDNGNSIFKGNAVVTNGNYSISCIPEIEAGVAGRLFKAIVTDTCENKTEQEFEIARVDTIAPEITSEDRVEDKWAKSKKFTFKAVDRGIGNVSIAFADIEDLKLANSMEENEYFRDYEFIGDVYTEKEISVLYKDELGNASIKKVTIDKLDNTAPTITNVNVHNNKLSIEANDRHEILGDGSGIEKYRYMTSREKLENVEVSTIINEINIDGNIVIPNISEIKYVYVVAEDLVGNVSDIYEVEIPQLILTSEVELDLANGKGGVKLDWSTYDISDKYFVIYRKEENAVEWETIVSLDKMFKGNLYIDEFANDKISPSVPSININGNFLDNNIDIISISSDSGSKYSYYIEAYDSNTLELVSVSN